MSYHLNLKLIFIFLFFILTIPFLFAQKKNTLKSISTWDRANYQEVNHENFRHNRLFKHKIDFANPDYPLLNACIFFATNEQRVKKNKPALEYVPELEIAAWNHSRVMAEQKFFSHTNSKDRRRNSPDARAQLAGISNPNIAENIAMRSGFEEKTTYLELADVFIEQWMNSVGHRNNILSDNGLQLGCGIFIKGVDWYATQCFQWFKPIKPQKPNDELP